jgi:uncharacterized protein YjbJ (UPF0337 family)
MNRDDIKGKGEEIKGEVKEKFGKATGDRSTQAEGMADKAKGKVRQGVGSAKREIRDTDDDIHRDREV